MSSPFPPSPGLTKTLTLPYKVKSGVRVADIVCGNDCTVIVKDEGGLLATGANRCNKLALIDEGDMSASTRSAAGMVATAEAHAITPVRAGPLKDVTVINVALGANHMALLTSQGMVFTSGSNQFGQLGRPRAEEEQGRAVQEQHGPGVVQALADCKVVAIACGEAHTAALTSANQLFMWGRHVSDGLSKPVRDVLNRPVECTPLPTAVPLPRRGLEDDNNEEGSVAQRGAVLHLAARYGRTAFVLAAHTVESDGGDNAAT